MLWNKFNSNKNNKSRISNSLNENIDKIREIFKEDKTLVCRFLQKNNTKFCIVYINGLVKEDSITSDVISKILYSDFITNDNDLAEQLTKTILSSLSIELSSDFEYVINSILNGKSSLFIDGEGKSILIDARGFSTRSIDEPASETIVRGPREGFNESIITNLSLIRRRIPHPDLKFIFKEVGKYTKTNICIAYISSISSEGILQEVLKRLDAIEIDSILDSGYISELICDHPFSTFQTIGYTERPDVVCSKILEGRIAIIVDGSPFALTLPYLLIEAFQSNEDYYSSWLFASFNRLIRILGFFLSTTIPSLFIALSNYHQELLPTPLLLSIAAAREGVPFPTVIEAFGMIFVFEILREAGTRLPKPVGQAVSIVGVLVIGEAAVSARFISAPMVIITALTGITEFLIPQLTTSIIAYRFIILFFTAFLGFYGTMFGLFTMFIQLFSMKSFGVPYTLHAVSIDFQNIKDTAIRVPWWAMKLRPILIGAKNKVRNTSINPMKGKDNGEVS
ncbi:Spore germination protein B1 [Caloramator mitchellensis]|uniref:Spore germination protein B1 n=1 Tax=Caloramator mitchellensis TaxID=908809 RepID=A0A0R3JUX1_CALMK|nr:spore germination protein [Caloramator mitchellensis]KRQ87367.1 Spore germination protein B1 [Caloramator mitchellensis]